MLFDEAPTVTTTTDAERQLATIQKLLMTRDVLATSAKRLPGRVGHLARRRTSGVGRPDANIVRSRASGSTPEAPPAPRTWSPPRSSHGSGPPTSRELPVGEEPAETRRSSGLKGTPGGAAQIALHPRAAERAAVSAATAGFGASARRPGTPPATPLRLVRSATPASRSSRRCSSPCSWRSDVSASRRESASRVSWSGSPAYPILSEMPESRRSSATRRARCASARLTRRSPPWWRPSCRRSAADPARDEPGSQTRPRRG